MGTHLVQHFLQSYRTQEVSWFDYGPERNLEVYGSETPTLIDYSLHEMPIGMYYSPIDGAADLEDGQWAADIIGDNVESFNIYPGYSHITFVIGNYQNYLDDLIDVLHSYPIPVPNMAEG